MPGTIETRDDWEHATVHLQLRVQPDAASADGLDGHVAPGPPDGGQKRFELDERGRFWLMTLPQTLLQCGPAWKAPRRNRRGIDNRRGIAERRGVVVGIGHLATWRWMSARARMAARFSKHCAALLGSAMPRRTHRLRPASGRE
jgi:hypothetical protein